MIEPRDRISLEYTDYTVVMSKDSPEDSSYRTATTVRRENDNVHPQELSGDEHEESSILASYSNHTKASTSPLIRLLHERDHYREIDDRGRDHILALHDKQVGLHPVDHRLRGLLRPQPILHCAPAQK